MNEFEAIYSSPDLYGEKLLKPWKIYYGFFSKKAAESSGMIKVAWIVQIIATSIFGALFGFSALIGICVKSTGVPGLKLHNTGIKKQIENIRHSIEAKASLPVEDLTIPEGYRYKTIKKALVKNFSSEYRPMIAKVEECEKKLRKLFLKIQIADNKIRKVSLCLLVPR